MNIKRIERFKFLIAAAIAFLVVVSAYKVYEVYLLDERPVVDKPDDIDSALPSLVAAADNAVYAGKSDDIGDSFEDRAVLGNAREETGADGDGGAEVAEESYLEGDYAYKAEDPDAGSEDGDAVDSQGVVADDAGAGSDGASNLIKVSAPRVPLDKYNSLLERNGDVAGWITIEGTRIDYEVMHDGTHYYLDHDIDHRKLTAGSIYMDPLNDPELDDYNTLIHGHNMKNGTMFKDLVKYKEREFFDSHRLIRFNTIFDDMLWEVFSVYVLDADYETIDTRFSGDDEFILAAEGFRTRSVFLVDGLKITPQDRILTLSTCSYETPNSRTIVHARLINKNGIFIDEPTVSKDILRLAA